MSVTVRGDTQLVAALGAIGDGLSHLEDTEQAAALVLATDARGRAPKRTGTLAQSIRAVAGTVGTPVRYGIPVHFGVPSRNQRPQPFLLEAVQAQSTQVLATYQRDVQALIDRSV